ncbi:MAG TPA: SUMF1/EgtB/PvdO family nonheme iron enzyme [Paludibacter sp.]|nr:SUMF1/EgtB/PvdO family nonheme iron enzyme [Paludibacter sp.]
MNRLLRILQFVVIAVLLIAETASASNITVSNISIVSRNDAAKYAVVQFDVTWDYSFRNGTGALENWDAAWVFLKYQKVGNEAMGYYHGTLSGIANHTIPTGYTGNQPTDNKGIFLYRSATGHGTATLTGVKLRWEYGTDGVDLTTNVNLKVFATEMVYVPTGAFWLGTESDGANQEYGFTKGAPATWMEPYKVTSENAIVMANSAGNLWAQGGGHVTGLTLAASYPKGYAAFYCMKHEITQKAYVDFLNTLTRNQQGYRVNTGSIGTTTSVTNRYVMGNNSSMVYRNGIRCDATLPAAPTPVEFYCDYDGDGVKNEDTDGQNIACGYLGWTNLAAYLDWAALRPMTELEFEKAARGPVYPTPNELAWGSIDYTKLGTNFSTALLDLGKATERPATAGVNCNLGGNTYLTRVGFATNDTTTRAQSGASYWGITELSGNAVETCVTVYNQGGYGYTYTGLNGDGALDGNGYHNAANWPATNGYGASWRGATPDNAYWYSAISNRSWANRASDDITTWYCGGRGVRTAP